MPSLGAMTLRAGAEEEAAWLLPPPRFLLLLREPPLPLPPLPPPLLPDLFPAEAAAAPLSAASLAAAGSPAPSVAEAIISKRSNASGSRCRYIVYEEHKVQQVFASLL